MTERRRCDDSMSYRLKMIAISILRYPIRGFRSRELFYIPDFSVLRAPVNDDHTISM